MQRKTKQNAFLIALALCLIALTSCGHGNESYTRVKVSEEFLDGLIAEQPVIEECCPYTVSITNDWIAQNIPD